MRRSSPRAFRVAAQLAGAVLCIVACSRAKKAGRAARASNSCEQLCRLVVRSSESGPSGQCHRGCLAQVFAAGPACEDSLINWMDCENARGVEEPSKAPDLAVSGRATPYCSRELRAVTDCNKDCQSAGILQTGEQQIVDSGSTRRVLYEVKYHGCSTCSVDKGAAARAPCSSPKVCASDCYGCRSGQSSVSLRACVEGRCAERSELDHLLHRLEVLGPCGS